MVCHALSGDAHAAGFSKTAADQSTRDGFGAEERDGAAGQGPRLVGRDDRSRQGIRHRPVLRRLHEPARRLPGDAPDPRRCDPATGRPYGSDFPVITVADMVRTQRAFLDELGIERLAAVAGGSLGGMQAFEWAILTPTRSTRSWRSRARTRCTRRAWPGTRSPGTRSCATRRGRTGTTTAPGDAGCRHGRRAHDRPHHLPLGPALRDKFGRRLQFADDIRYTVTEPEFEVESYLRHQADSFVKRFDANTYLYTSRALTYFDLARQYGARIAGARSARTSPPGRC